MSQAPEIIEVKKGPVNQNWWEKAVLAELAKDPTPWGDDAVVPVEQEDIIKVRITREMLHEYSPDNPQGRNIWKSFAKYEELGPLSIGGIRYAMNIANVHDTRQVKNSFERLLTSLSLGLMVKILYNKGAFFPYQTNYGHEVRYHSNTLQDITVRTLAALGFICHIVPENVPTAIWNTATMGKFFNFVLSFCGTSSHSESNIDGLKIMDYEGSQFLIATIEAMVAIQRAILEKIESEGYVDFYLSAKDDPRITDALYRLTHNGMYVYRKYQEKTAADDTVLDSIRSLDPSSIHIDCAHGAGYRTLTAFFKEMSLSGITEKIDWMHIEERPDFGNIGKLLENLKTGEDEIFDLGADATQVVESVLPSGKILKYFPVLCTADYPEKFAAMPIDDIILHTDMDNDRLVVSQILSNDEKTRELLDKIGIIYNVVNNEKLVTVFAPNKFFHLLHEMNFQRLTALMEQGIIDKDRTLVVLKTLASTPAVDKWAAKRGEEGHNIAVINTAVGFAKLANVMYRVEGEMGRNPGKDVIITDAGGSEINVGANPILIAAWEESGGIIVGITYGFEDVLGNSFLAEREKSATESIFLSLALISKLQQETGKVDLADYVTELYERNEIDTPTDFRFEDKLFVPGTTQASAEAEEEGNKRKNRIFGAYLSLAIAYMREQLPIAQVKPILRDIFNQEFEARKAQGTLQPVLIERFGQVDIDSLIDLKFTGDGVMFIFEKKRRQWMVLFRPSGTEPKLKSYGFGEDPDRLTIDTWAFAFNENVAGVLPKSFTSNAVLIRLWGDDGAKAVDKARRMQAAWEVFGRVIDPEDLSEDELAKLEESRLIRSFMPPDDHLEVIQKWVEAENLGELAIDLSQPQAMPQEGVVDLLEAIPDEVFENLARTKQEVLDKERSAR